MPKRNSDFCATNNHRMPHRNPFHIMLHTESWRLKTLILLFCDYKLPRKPPKHQLILKSSLCVRTCVHATNGKTLQNDDIEGKTDFHFNFTNSMELSFACVITYIHLHTYLNIYPGDCTELVHLIVRCLVSVFQRFGAFLWEKCANEIQNFHFSSLFLYTLLVLRFFP